MDRPLWRIFLSLFLVAFVVRRAAVVFLVRSEGFDPALVTAYSLQGAAGLAAAIGLWWARSWVIAAVIALGVAVGATVLLEGFFLGLVPRLAAVGQLTLTAVATGGLVLLLRHEFDGADTAREVRSPDLRDSA